MQILAIFVHLSSKVSTIFYDRVIEKFMSGNTATIWFDTTTFFIPFSTTSISNI